MLNSFIQDAAIARIRMERERQEEIHPMKKFPGDAAMLAVLVEEVGEVAQAIQEKNRGDMEEELLQVAAVCLRWLENKPLGDKRK